MARDRSFIPVPFHWGFRARARIRGCWGFGRPRRASRQNLNSVASGNKTKNGSRLAGRPPCDGRHMARTPNVRSGHRIVSPSFQSKIVTVSDLGGTPRAHRSCGENSISRFSRGRAGRPLVTRHCRSGEDGGMGGRNVPVRCPTDVPSAPDAAVHLPCPPTCPILETPIAPSAGSPTAARHPIPPAGAISSPSRKGSAPWFQRLRS